MDISEMAREMQKKSWAKRNSPEEIERLRKIARKGGLAKKKKK